MPICLRADLSPRSAQEFPKKEGEKKRIGLRRKILALEIRQKNPRAVRGISWIFKSLHC